MIKLFTSYIEEELEGSHFHGNFWSCERNSGFLDASCLASVGNINRGLSLSRSLQKKTAIWYSAFFDMLAAMGSVMVVLGQSSQ